MSRQSKNAKRLAKAREISVMHKNGDKGPAKTQPKHGKRWGYRDNPERLKRVAEMLKASQQPETVLEKINADKAKKSKQNAARTAAEA